MQYFEEFLGDLPMKFQLSFSGCHTTVIHIIFKTSRIVVSKGLENMVYEPLHACGGIGWSEAHYFGGIESSGCFKGHQILCFLTVANVPITVA
jgi:hypothetical protein